MTSDSDVQVKFGAQIDGLVAGVNEAKESIESITAPIDGIVSSFQALGEATVAALAIDTVYDYQKELASLGEEIERTANLTGLSTDEVQKFQFAVKMTGGDAETAATSLLLLERNIAQAQSGSGRAYEAFMNLGVSLNDLKTKSPNEILLIMAKRFSETGTSAEQAATKIDYMRTVAGRAGTNLIPLLNQGPEGLQKISDVLDSTNSKLSPGMVEALAEAKRSSIEADAAWKGFYQTIGSNDFFAAVNRDMIDLAHAATEVARTVQLASKAFDDFIGGEEDRIPTEAEKFTAAANEFKAVMAGAKPGEGFGPVTSAAPKGNPLPPLPVGGEEKEDDTGTQIALDQIKTQESLAKIGLQTQKDMLEQEVAAQQLTKAQEYATLQDYLGLEYQVESESLDKKLELYDSDSREYKEALNEKQLLDAQYTQQLQKLAAEQAAAQQEELKKTQESYKGFFDTIDKDLDTMLQGVLQGTQTWQQAMVKVFDNLALSFIEDIAKMLVKWAAFEAAQSAFGTGDTVTKSLGEQVPTQLGGSAANTALGAAMTKLAGLIGLNTVAHTAGTVATTGNTVATATDTIATATGTVATTGLTVATATDAAANVAQLGLNTIDTGVNTAAIMANTTALFASKAIPSYDVGSWNIPSDQIAQVHAGEMIIPAAQAGEIRSGTASLGGSTSTAGGSGSVVINLNAIDTQTGAQFLKNNMSVIAKGIAGASRNFNSNLRT